MWDATVNRTVPGAGQGGLNARMCFIAFKSKPQQSGRSLDGYILYRLIRAQRSRLTRVSLETLWRGPQRGLSLFQTQTLVFLRRRVLILDVYALVGLMLVAFIRFFGIVAK